MRKKKGAAFAAPGVSKGQEETRPVYRDPSLPDVRWRTWRREASEARLGGLMMKDG
jgi:hypothetical protein